MTGGGVAGRPHGAGGPAQMRVLVAGYGVLTQGILPHLAARPGFSVGLTSRHQVEPPLPGVESVDAESVQDFRPDVILGCFASDRRSRAFWTDSRTRRAIAERGAGCIEMSTLSLDRAQHWHAEITAAGGVGTESPVTGSRSGASAGTLSAFVYQGVPDPRADQVLRTFTRRRYDFSAPGHPTRFKLVYNAWGASLLYSMAAFVPVLRESLGEDFTVAEQVVRSDGWMAPVCASKLDRMLSGRYDDPDFAVQHMVKDLDQAAEVLGPSHELLALVREAFDRAAALHGPGADYTAVTGGQVR
ncbi:NAD(P)-binding domain-containing protein [Kitasatospora sp. NPDC086801]|uniref:NAD(P)-binding domain-containing protein n=1 Tax=Kitasatospora sp. NPDC086801 TaxID=3364066 RepID=UPI00380A6B4D